MVEAEWYDLRCSLPNLAAVLPRLALHSPDIHRSMQQVEAEDPPMLLREDLGVQQRSHLDNEPHRQLVLRLRDMMLA
jgi:hypothetical protein